MLFRNTTESHSNESQQSKEKHEEEKKDPFKTDLLDSNEGVKVEPQIS